MTISQYIQAGSTKANELFAKLAETGPGALKTRERLLDELKVELELHARLEREHLVPALRKHEETKTLIPGLTEDTKHVAKLLGDLENMAKDGDEFLPKLGELKRTFQQHVRDDRKELLPTVKNALSREEAAAVADAIEADKAAVDAEKRTEADARRAQERLIREAAELQAQRAAETEKSVKQTAADARQTARAAAEISRHSMDGAEQTMKNAARALTGASASSVRGLELSMRHVGQGAEQATRGMAAMVGYGSAVSAAMHEGVQAWTAWVQDSAAANATGLQALLGCRSAPDFAAVQTGLIQKQISLMAAGTRRVSEAAARTSGKAIEAMAARAQANAVGVSS